MEADDRHHRDERVLQRMSQHDPVLGEPLPGPSGRTRGRGPAQARSGDPHHDGGDGDPSVTAGTERLGPGDALGPGAPGPALEATPRATREDEDQEDRQPEARQGDTGDGHQRGDHIHHRVAAERSQDSGWKADRERDEQRGHGETQRHGCRWRIASMTGWFVRMDRPSSPWTARPSHVKYCRERG